MSGIGTTLGEVLAAVTAAYPALQILQGDGVSPEYLVSLDGARFTTDLAEPLVEGDSVLILGADAGG
jgi:molybdopterin converting factor small subunit